MRAALFILGLLLAVASALTASAQSTISQPNAYLLFPELAFPTSTPVSGKQLMYVKAGVGVCTKDAGGAEHCPGGGGGGAGTVTSVDCLTGLVCTPDPITSAGTIDVAPMGAHTLKGNNTGSSGPPLDLTGTQATAELDLFSSTLKGLVPGSGGGTTNFLRADGTWVSPGSAGVTSVDCIAGLTCTPDPIVGTGTIGIGSGQVTDAMLANNYSGIGTCTNQFARVLNDNAAPTCASVNLSSDTTGTLPLAKLTDDNTTSGLCLLSGGAGGDPAYTTCPGGGGSGTVTSVDCTTGLTCTPDPIIGAGTVALTTPVAIANGGTNGTTALVGFNNLSPLTTRGDLLTRDASNNVRLGIGGAATFLRSNATDPSWQAIATGDLPVIPLSTGTSGNYVADVACNAGIDCGATSHGATISFNTDSTEDQFMFDLGATDLTCTAKTGASGVGSADPINGELEYCANQVRKHVTVREGIKGGQNVAGGTQNNDKLILRGGGDISTNIWDGTGVQIEASGTPGVLYTTAGPLAFQGTYVPLMFNAHDGDTWTGTKATCTADNTECTGAGLPNTAVLSTCCTGAGTGTCGYCNGPGLPVPCDTTNGTTNNPTCYPVAGYMSHWYHRASFSDDSNAGEAFYVMSMGPTVTGSGGGLRTLSRFNLAQWGPVVAIPNGTNLQLGTIEGILMAPTISRQDGGTSTAHLNEVFGLKMYGGATAVGAGGSVDTWDAVHMTNPAVSGGGVLGDLVGVEIENLTSGGVSGCTGAGAPVACCTGAGAGSCANISLRSAGAATTLRHAGPAIFGSSTTAPTQPLEVVGSNTTGVLTQIDWTGDAASSNKFGLVLFQDGATMSGSTVQTGINGGGTTTISGGTPGSNFFFFNQTIKNASSAGVMTSAMIPYTASPRFRGDTIASTSGVGCTGAAAPLGCCTGAGTGACGGLNLNNVFGLPNLPWYKGFAAEPTFDVVSGSTGNNAGSMVIGVNSTATVGTGWTADTIYHHRLVDVGVAGALANQIGLEINALTTGLYAAPIEFGEHTISTTNNASCTASGKPYACCSGAAAGTCGNVPSGKGVIGVETGTPDRFYYKNESQQIWRMGYSSTTGGTPLNTTLSTTATEYIGIDSRVMNATENSADSPVIGDLHVFGMACGISVVPGGSATRTFTLRDDAANASPLIACVIGAAVRQCTTRNESGAAIAVGSMIDISSVPTNTPAAAEVTCTIYYTVDVW